MSNTESNTRMNLHGMKSKKVRNLNTLSCKSEFELTYTLAEEGEDFEESDTVEDFVNAGGVFVVKNKPGCDKNFLQLIQKNSTEKSNGIPIPSISYAKIGRHKQI